MKGGRSRNAGTEVPHSSPIVGWMRQSLPFFLLNWIGELSIPEGGFYRLSADSVRLCLLRLDSSIAELPYESIQSKLARCIIT